MPWPDVEYLSRRAERQLERAQAAIPPEVAAARSGLASLYLERLAPHLGDARREPSRKPQNWS